MRYMSYPYGDPSDGVPYELLGTVSPKPMEYRDVNEDKFLPLSEGVRREEGSPKRLGK